MHEECTGTSGTMRTFEPISDAIERRLGWRELNFQVAHLKLCGNERLLYLLLGFPEIRGNGHALAVLH
jgi:hypothetical protein